MLWLREIDGRELEMLLLGKASNRVKNPPVYGHAALQRCDIPRPGEELGLGTRLKVSQSTQVSSNRPIVVKKPFK